MEVPEADLDAAAMAALRERFHAAHERLYGYALRNAPVELVNLRVTATVPLPKAQSATVEAHAGSVDAARIGERQVYFGRAPAARRGAGPRLDGDAALRPGAARGWRGGAAGRRSWSR